MAIVGELFLSLLQVLGVLGLLWLLGALALGICGHIARTVRMRQLRRRERQEAELDRKQEELRHTIFQLAEALAEERVVANETKRELLRAAYVMRGELPQK